MFRHACALACVTLLGCDGATVTEWRAAHSESSPDTRLEALLGGEGAQGFALALAPRTFEFPRDHGPHQEFRHEWWYFTGHLDGPNDERFGFELTFFRYALAPPSSAVAGSSRWRSRQIYVAHFAITDVARGAFHSAERRAREALELAGARAGPLRLWVLDWSMDFGPSAWQLSAADGPYSLSLALEPVVGPVLHGEQGLSRKSATPGAASFYYSIPRLVARGELWRDDQRREVSGTAWLDREWGSSSLAQHQEGWDWFALQLDDGSALMFYSLRKRDGTPDPFSAGTWIEADGRARPLSGADIEIAVLDHWRSRGGHSYPARWRLRLPVSGVDIELRPVIADQELDTTPRYWEGAVDVRGKRGEAELSGRGYVELTGYAGRE